MVCDECSIMQKHCANGGNLNEAACLCDNCQGPYGGPTCDRFMTADEKALDVENKRVIIKQALQKKKKADVLKVAQDTAEELTTRLLAKGAKIQPQHLTPVFTSLLASSKDSPMSVSKDPSKLLTAGQFQRIMSAMSENVAPGANAQTLKSELHKLTAQS